MNDIWLLDESLRVRIFYDCNDCNYEDNVCISLYESCPPDEKVFKADETNLFLTPEQANQLALALIHAARQSMGLEATTPQSNHSLPVA